MKHVYNAKVSYGVNFLRSCTLKYYKTLIFGRYLFDAIGVINKKRNMNFEFSYTVSNRLTHSLNIRMLDT